MGAKVNGLTRVDEAVNWLQSFRPDALTILSSQGAEMKAVIDTADLMGEKEDNYLMQARFLVGASNEMFPVIALSIYEANKRKNRARLLSLVARGLTLCFSVGTLTALNLMGSVKTAQWLAVGSILSSLATLLSGHFNRLGEGKKTLTAEDALTKLADLDFDLRRCSYELASHIERGSAGKALVDCINRTNVICKELNTLAAPLETLRALKLYQSLTGDLNARHVGAAA